MQAVMAETANGDLVPTALRCMERGVAIHMDKPGGTDLALFKELRQNCEARAIPFQMGYMFRNNPALMWIRKAVKAGWLGPVFKIEADMNHDYGGDAYQEHIGAGVRCNVQSGLPSDRLYSGTYGTTCLCSAFFEECTGGAQYPGKQLPGSVGVCGSTCDC